MWPACLLSSSLSSSLRSWWYREKRKALFHLVPEFLLLFTLNDKTACDHVSGLMSASHTAPSEASETVNSHSKGHLIEKKIPPEKTNVFYLTVYIFSICLLRLCNFSLFVSMKCLKNGREQLLLNDTFLSEGFVLYLCCC